VVEIRLFQQQSLDTNPHLFAVNRLMQLSVLEIEQAVIQALDSKPALEVGERSVCSGCGSVLQFGICQQWNCSSSDLSSQLFFKIFTIPRFCPYLYL